ILTMYDKRCEQTHNIEAEIRSFLGDKVYKAVVPRNVKLSEALDIVCNVIDNQVLKKALLEARDKIIKQGKMSQYLKQTNVFPPIATYLISTGEESGQLDTMLLAVSKNYEKELGERADTLSALIDPIMMIVMMVVVGFIVMAIAMPMMNMGQAFGA
ncbi:hypothetical protein EBU24_06480, partial [bacterium]|nr:hypothetical protein [bacterium]